MSEYYYYDGVDSAGPHSAEGMMELLKNQLITPDTLVFDEGLDDWVPLSDFHFPEFSQKPTHPPKAGKKAASGPPWHVRFKKPIMLVMAAATAFVVYTAFYVLCFASEPYRSRGDLGPAEPWASQSKYSWPQMVLSNKAWFKGRTELAGASAFLFRHADGEIYAATAKHLLGAAGGVAPAVSLKDFNADLVFWFLTPRSSREKKIQVAGLGKTSDKRNNDWLILKVIQDANLSQVIPLRLRSIPVAVDEKVHLVGVPDQESGTQNVYTGKVTSRSDDRFRFDIYPTADLTGFSGAPILDENGLVVGIMTVEFQARKDGTQWLEAGGEDALTALDMMQ